MLFIQTSFWRKLPDLLKNRSFLWCVFCLNDFLCADIPIIELTHLLAVCWYYIHFCYWVISASSQSSAIFSSVDFGFTVSFLAHTLTKELWWSDAWRHMCKYCRCLSCGPACKMSFVRQVMVRIWLADALTSVCVYCMCICLGERKVACVGVHIYIYM